MKKILTLISCIAFGSCLFAQQIFQPFIRLNVDDADKNSITLTDLKIETKLTSNIAVTTFDMIFANSSSRILEGEFQFPLADGQSVFDFALDINGSMRNGVAVEKEKGRQVFEDIVRRGIDPGLLEMTEGNNFKTRIYPIPSKGSRHVKISYLEKLDGKNKYVVNPIVENKIKNFSFSFTDYSKQNKNKVDSDGFEFNTGSIISTEKKDFIWDKPITINVDTKSQVFIENKGTDTYFYYNFPVAGDVKVKSKTKNLAVFYDTSLSGKNRNQEKELEFLKEYLNANVSGSVQVVIFANDIKEKRDFKASEWSKIEAYIKAQEFDGGTNLSGLKVSGKFDEIILFTDGLHNWNQKSAEDSGTKTMVVNSSVSADYGQLKQIARKNKGAFIDLNQCSVKEGISAAKQEPMHLISIEYDGNVFTDVVPGMGSEVYGSGTVAGILKKKSGDIKLVYGYGNKAVCSEKVTVSAVGGVEAENISRFWAQMKIDELALDYESNKNAILDLGKKFTIVTKETSLIVLENISDYVRYGIVPPDELKAEYDSYVSRNSSKPTENQGIPLSVYKGFEEYKEWWYKKPGDFINNDSPVLYEEAPVRVFTESINSANVIRNSARATLDRVNEDVAADTMAFEESSFEPPAAFKTQASGSEEKTGKISIQAWNPDNDYLKELKKTETKLMYLKYLKLRQNYEQSPSFYMDVSAYFFEEGLKTEAIRIISNLAEINLENSDILRALGNKLVDFGEYKIAAVVFEKLTNQFAEIPQFYRDYALCCQKLGEYQKAADSLYYIVSHNWDNRFNLVQLIAINDLNALINTSGKKINTSNYDSKLLADLPVDIRIVLTWNTDNCDIDLWVTDPSGEKCFYGHKKTVAGGRISRDFTQGYGPEEFCIKEAPEGKYLIQAHYYGSHAQKVLQPVVVNAEVYTNYGTKKQKCQILTLQLANVNGDFTIGEIEF